MSVLMQVGGNCARIFTTMTEVNDFAVLGSYLLSAALNGTILLQILFYWKATIKFQEENKPETTPKAGVDAKKND